MSGVFKCWGCSATMSLVQRLLENDWFHNSLLKIASDICDISGVVGHRFEICPQLVSQFGEPMFDVFEQYIFTKDRICVEMLGICKSPTITEIDLTSVCDNVLATKPAHV